MRLRNSLVYLVLPVAFGQKVTIANGTIQGGKCPTSPANFYHSIPFAQPPIGNLRFATPQPYNQEFNGTLNATKAAPSCIQFNSQAAEPRPWSENCLFLNVWTPQNASSCSKLPVKVWVYGGSNLGGGISNPMYDGCNIAVDSIVVSINYRLGPLGFLGLAKAGLSGNYAVQDILLGLQWVQDNIEAFGGDSSKVLLFGESAGAALSFAVSTLPEAPSLISALAADSGGGRGVAPYDEAQPYFELFAKNLGCEVTDLDCLRSKSPSELSAAFPSSSASSITLSYAKGFAPVIDGTIITSDPAKVGTRVPTIFGSTTADGSLFTLTAYQETFPPTEANYTSFIASNFGPYASLVEKYYPVSKFANISSAQLAPYLAMRTIWTHASYTCSAYRGLIKAREKGIPAYAFLWDVSPSCPWQSQLGALAQQNPKIMQLLGATHTSELPYIFRNMEDLPAPNGTCAFPPKEKEIGDQMASAWTAMANFQTPRSDLIPVSWPEFESNQTEGLRATNEGISFGVIDYSPCELWNEITEALATSGNKESIK